MAAYYFAYGSNMNQSAIDELGASEFVGVAHLNNHRLAFTRRTLRGSGAADVVRTDRCRVYGVLYKISDDTLSRLDAKEGYPDAYTRIKLPVQLSAGDEPEIAAWVYVVVEKEFEVAPAPEYIDKIIVATKERGMGANYQSFLHSLKKLVESLSPGDRFDRLYLTSTEDRSGSHGLPLVRVNPRTVAGLSSRGFVAVRYGTRIAVGRLVKDPRVPIKECQVDQTIRRTIGLPGLRVFGTPVEVLGVSGRVPVHRLIRARTLVLNLRRTYAGDSEKDVAVLDPRNLRLLGLEDGAFIRLLAATPDPRSPNSVKVTSINARSFGGTADALALESLGGAQQRYPLPDKVYLDADMRRRLGVLDSMDHPILIQANVWRSISSRILFYGLSFFFGVTSILELLAAFAGGSSPALRGILSIVLSLILTVAIAILETRSRLRAR